MAREFQPYGATWAELKNKSGMARTTFKRGFNWATDSKWFVGGGGQNKPFFLNPDGSWRRALDPDGVGPNLDPETVMSGPGSVPAWTGNEKVDSHLATIGEAIQHVDQKKRS
jgi:hypothetical protein